ncbi:MAG: transposase [Pseudomonadota bacterium]
MPNYRRRYVPGGTYFFTITLKDRASDLLVREIDALRAAWRDARRARPFDTVAAVVLPDHLHVLIALPEDDDDFAARISHLKSSFTRCLPDDAKSTGRKGARGVWQSRFWEHAIRHHRDLAAHVDYIHWNPVKHGYVDDPEAWPHSTLLRRTVGRASARHFQVITANKTAGQGPPDDGG